MAIQVELKYLDSTKEEALLLIVVEVEFWQLK